MQVVLNWLRSAWDWLKGVVEGAYDYAGKVLKAVFMAAWDFLQDAFSWVLDQLLGIAVSAANALDLSALQGHANDWSIMPAEIVNVMQLSGLAVAIPIVVAAIGIRLVLQLIPFTRLGS